MERFSRRMDSDDFYKIKALITAVDHTRIVSYIGSKLEAKAAHIFYTPR